MAEDLGITWQGTGKPRLKGETGGVPFILEFRQLGGARTIAGAVQEKRVGRKLVVYPRRAELHTRHDHETGDQEFDRAFRAVSSEPRLVERFLHPAARQWIAVVSPERVVLRGRTVTAWCPACVSDPDRLRGLIELVTAMANPPNYQA